MTTTRTVRGVDLVITPTSAGRCDICHDAPRTHVVDGWEPDNEFSRHSTAACRRCVEVAVSDVVRSASARTRLVGDVPVVIRATSGLTCEWCDADERYEVAICDVPHSASCCDLHVEVAVRDVVRRHRGIRHVMPLRARSLVAASRIGTLPRCAVEFRYGKRCRREARLAVNGKWRCLQHAGAIRP